MRYVALKRMKLGLGFVEPGEEVPGAAAWPTLESLVSTGFIERIVEPTAPRSLVEVSLEDAGIEEGAEEEEIAGGLETDIVEEPVQREVAEEQLPQSNKQVARSLSKKDIPKWVMELVPEPSPEEREEERQRPKEDGTVTPAYARWRERKRLVELGPDTARKERGL